MTLQVGLELLGAGRWRAGVLAVAGDRLINILLFRLVMCEFFA